MADLSEYEEKYFLDGQKYNCPFCNVRAAKYSVEDNTYYHEKHGEKRDEDKDIYVYIVSCDLCGGRSIHLTNWEWNMEAYGGRRLTNPFTSRPRGLSSDKYPEWSKLENQLDIFFFYHYPSSFFTIDENIPEKIRKLVSEAENCKEMNFMVGASGALRKAIYKFLKHEEAEGEKYDDKIEFVKAKYQWIKGEYFNALKDIKDMNDQDMHEEDWEPFKPKEFNFLIGTLKTILYKIYVEPKKEESMWTKVQAFKAGRKKVEATQEEPSGEDSTT